MPTCELSVIIVSYNSQTDLSRCLPTLLNQSDITPFELIVVDNHGNDGVEHWLASHYPTVLLIRNPINSGYAGGNNLGLKYAKGKWILFLNPDTELAADCLSQLLKTARKYPTAFLTPKLLKPDGTVNACGNEMHYTGVTTCRGINKPSAEFDQLEITPLLSGAALLAAKAILQRIGAFDDTYFMYFEDTNLSLRARLAGFQLYCEPKAIITHHYSLGMSPQKFYYLERNRLLTFFQIFTAKTNRELLPALIFTEILMWAYSIRNWRYVLTRFKTYKYLWQHRAVIRSQYHQIQKTRLVSDKQLMEDSLTTIPFEQILPKPIGSFLKAITYPIYALLRPRSIS